MKDILKGFLKWLGVVCWIAFIALLVVGFAAKQYHWREMQQRLDLQRACIEALEDKTQTLADSLGIEW